MTPDIKQLKRGELVSLAVLNENAALTNNGALSVTTGQYTGRSPDAKYIVKDSITEATVDWQTNKEMSIKEWEEFKTTFLKDAQLKTLYLQKRSAGADPNIFVNLKIHTSLAWHSLFALNMFRNYRNGIRGEEWTIFYIPEITAPTPRVVINFSEKLILISGTQYAGEMKKSVFTVLNFLYPENNSLPMHCSININPGSSPEPTVFFGLSGTGKTTLSADKKRILLGDDEHGWTSEGLNNFEGGCYAKTIDLSPETEPLIWNACHQFGTILENVVLENGDANFFDDKYTKNSRASYPLSLISPTPAYTKSQPTNIIMLTCDAFGVLPPISKLNPVEARNWFLLGYTAKVAGTERGITEPVATFSPCFGLPFMPRPAKVYGQILKDFIDKNDVNCWLLNTGWSGGMYGKGSRMPISLSRDIIDSIHDGSLEKTEFIFHRPTGLHIPVSHPYERVDDRLMNPESTWENKEAYLTTAQHLSDKINYEIGRL